MKIRELFEENSNSEFAKKWISKWMAACTGNLAKYKNEISNCDFQNNGDVVYQGNLYILDDDFLDENKEIPIQVAQCRRFQIASTNITSFKNSPKFIAGSSNGINDWVFLLRKVFGDKEDFNSLRSLEGITPIIPGNINLAPAHNLSYSKVDKHIKEIDGHLRISGQYVGPLLSFLKVKKLDYIMAGVNPIDETDRACEIISAHLQSDRNIVACQEELFQNNLDMYAKL